MFTLGFLTGTPSTAENLIHPNEGQKPIAEIKEGHKVFAEDPTTGEQGYFEVVAVTSHPEDEILQITIDSDDDQDDNNTQQLNSDTMEVTPEHPIYIKGKGWLWAENLSIGDQLRRSDGGMARVLAIERVILAEPELVYNFTVKGPHTYFVLNVGVLVHNCDWPGRKDASGNPAVGPYNSRSDVTLEQLEEFHLEGHHLKDSYGYQLAREKTVWCDHLLSEWTDCATTFTMG